MSDIRQTPNSNVQSVTINYPSSATGQNPQLQIFNSPGGSNSQIQFNAGNGKFAGSSNMIWNNANRILNVLGTVRASTLQGKITTNLTNFKITGGNAGDTITTDGTGNLTWVEGENYTNVNVASFLVSYTGNITANNLILSNNFTVNATSTTRSINANGNITANFFIGNASALTSLTGANVTGQVGNSLIAGTVYTNSQPNITSIGILTSLTVLGNSNLGNSVTANYFIGDGSLLTGLPEQYANSNVANYLPTYTGNLTSGNISVTGSIIVANVEADQMTIQTNDGDLIIQSDSDVFVKSSGGTNEWQFGVDGNLTLPYGSKLFAVDPDSVELTAGNGNSSYASLASFNANTYIWVDNNSAFIGTSWQAGPKTWIFDNTGNMTAPGAINVGNMSIGELPGYITAEANIGIILNTSGPDGGFVVDYLKEDGNANTSGGELAFSSETGNATYRISLSDDLGDGFATKIWRFDGTGNLTLPTNSFNVNYANGTQVSLGGIQSEIANGISNVNISTSGGAVGVTAGTQHWAFGTDGTLTAPNDSQIVPAGNNFNIYTNGVNGAIQFFTDVTGNNHNWAFDGYGFTQLPFSQGYSNTAVITSVGAGNIMLQAGAGPTQDYLFGSDGLLTLPGGNVTIGNQFGAQAILSNNESFGLVTSGNAATVVQWSDDVSNTSLISALYVNGPGGNVGDIQIRTGDISNANVWTFAADGTLTIPSSISGTGASPAPSLFGFDSLDAININASGNMSASYFIGDGSLLTGLGNVSTINLDGNASNILYGNGSFAAAPSGGGYGDSNVATLLSSFGSNTISTTGNISVGNINVASVTATANISTTGYFISGNQATGGFQLGNSNSRLKAGDSNSYMTMGQNPAIYPDTAASATAGVLIGGNGYILGNNGARNITLNYSGTSGLVGLQSNVQVGTGGSGTVLVPGTVNTGVNSMLAGPTFTPLPNTMAGFVSNVNSYTQLTIQNKSAGADATVDFIATADNGSDTVNYLDLGIINSGYDSNTPTNSLGNIVSAADSYLYAQGNVSNTSQSGGNLAIGTTTSGKTVKIFAGGNTSSSIIATVSNTGMTVNGNVTANNFSGNITITGNINGTSPNVSLVAGNFTATFDNTGVLTLPTNGGDEGGEIRLGIPATNTTLANRVTVDVYQDRFRIFEGSGSAKGVYVDLSQSSAGVGTLLNNRVSGFANAGSYITMDNIKATVTTSGPRGLSLATVSGSFNYSIGGTYGAITSVGGASTTGTLTTTPTSSIFGWGFTATGDIATYVLTDTTNNKCYRITVHIQSSFNNNSITIERLI